MKRYFILLVTFLTLQATAQTEIKGRSQPQYFNITKDPPKPPILALVPGSLQFTDADGNRAINANESASISFEVQNKGYGAGIGLVATANTKNTIPGLSFDSRINLSSLAINGTTKVLFPVTAGMDLPDGLASFVLGVEEPNGFNMDPVEIQISTRAFVSPLVKATDYTITSESSNLLRKRPFDLQVLVQNVQAGKAENVQVNLQFPDDVILMSDNKQLFVGDMEAGQTENITYNLIVSDRYQSETIPFEIKLSERYGRYAENRTITAAINQSTAGSKLIVEGQKKAATGNITIATLTSDVDRDIPQNPTQYPNRYALIIGNEDYATYQRGLKKESNVDFAASDARSFEEYAKKVLGIKPNQITTLINAQNYQIEQELNRLKQIIEHREGQAEVFFYYSGHGVPDNAGNAYILPVNISATEVEQAGFRVDKLYQSLTANNPQRVTVFMDACFSGAGRNQGLLAAKAAVRIKPTDENQLKGNLVVFTSSKDEQKSQFDADKKHGVFTYYLLKKLKETKGNVSYDELASYLSREVPLFLLEKRKEVQNPQLLTSPQVERSWSQWNFSD